MFYSLGDSEREQDGLIRQTDLYGDTEEIRLEAGDAGCELGCGAGGNLSIAKQQSRGRYDGYSIT